MVRQVDGRCPPELGRAQWGVLFNVDVPRKARLRVECTRRGEKWVQLVEFKPPYDIVVRIF